MRAKMLLFALPALVCRAQDATLVGLPEYGVILTGTPAAPRPVIVDGRHKSILGYTINRIGAAGFELVVTRNFRLNQDWDIGIPGSTPSGNRAVQNSGPITPGMPTAPAMQGEGVPVKAVLEF